MLEIKDIVNVVINRETTSKTIRDLQTIAVLSGHNHFTPTETYRIYSSTTEMLNDGFTTDEYAYVAANRIFSQNPQVRNIVVGVVTPQERLHQSTMLMIFVSYKPLLKNGSS